eukprot:421003_1
MGTNAKVCLVSIDGWGLAPPSNGNAVTTALTPNMDALAENADQYAQLHASGLHVGLPKGVMGNSEVGHLTMGAGRAKFQDLVRINCSIEDGSFFTNKVLLNAFERARTSSGRLHLLGLVSDGGVHSHIDHLFAFLKAAKGKVPEAFVHFFADGRDTPPSSAHKYIKQVLDYLDELEFGTLATVIGRYYAMDRDKRWDRVQLAYDALVKNAGEHVSRENLIKTVQNHYASGTTDEFLKPIILGDGAGCIQDGDTLIFIDFRSDRMREIVEVFGIKPPFETDVVRKDLHVVQMTQYNADFPLPILFLPQPMDNVLAEWLSKQGIRQFHTAETEKYAHVTFFFNGGQEVQFDLEERALVQSPKVATYDLAPEMSQAAVADSVISAVESGEYPFVMCNFAPPDMVGHTGNMAATVKACAHTDQMIGKLMKVCKAQNFILMVTSDHGNAEEMLDGEGNPKTSHNSNLVPFCVYGDDRIKLGTDQGTLADVAPTILDVMGVPIPKEMTGKSLLKK